MPARARGAEGAGTAGTAGTARGLGSWGEGLAAIGDQGRAARASASGSSWAGRGQVRGESAGRGERSQVGAGAEVSGAARPAGTGAGVSPKETVVGLQGHVSFHPGSLWCNRSTPETPEVRGPPEAPAPPHLAVLHSAVAFARSLEDNLPLARR